MGNLNFDLCSFDEKLMILRLFLKVNSSVKAPEPQKRSVEAP